MPSHPIQPPPRIHPLEWLTVYSRLVFVSADEDRSRQILSCTDHKRKICEEKQGRCYSVIKSLSIGFVLATYWIMIQLFIQ